MPERAHKMGKNITNVYTNLKVRDICLITKIRVYDKDAPN